VIILDAMSRPANPFVLHTILAIILLVILFSLPLDGVALWKKIIAAIFCVSLGFQLARAYQTGRQNQNLAWIEGLGSMSFVLLILGVFLVPTLGGWILLISGLVWRPLVAKVLK